MAYGKLLQEAIEFAAKAHAGVPRKDTDIPYIVHPIEVMKIVCGLSDDEAVRAAAVLHDTVEDVKSVTVDTIKAEFDENVARLVAAESENKREDRSANVTWLIRKQETLDHLDHAERDAKIICLGDKLANMRDIARDSRALGDEFWSRFNAPDDGKGLDAKIAHIGWYYRGVADRLKPELGSTPAWQELDELIKEVFGVRP